MKCPKCGNELKNNRCENCKKGLKDIYLKLSEEAQVDRDYEKALFYLKEAENYMENDEDKEEVEKLISTIHFSRFEEKESQDIFEGIIDKEQRKEDNSAKKDYIYLGFKKIVFIAIILIILAGVVEYFRIVYYKNMKIKNTVIDNRKLKTAFLFHLNQGHGSFSDIADRASYNGLIKTLRKHPKLKFNLHISGTLIQDLLWYNPETLDMIKAGVDEGQFEILGSTYSQNVMYSTDELSNRWQIERHKEIIKEVFGVEPIGFWNAERTWRQDLGELIAEYGYKYTFVEDHILKDSGTQLQEHFLRSTNNGNLLIINDDFEFLPIFNSAVDAGDIEDIKENRGPNLSEDHIRYKELFGYMRNIYIKDKENNFLLNYAEDGEATGLWDLERRSTPEFDFINLDFLLSEIEKKTWIEVVRYDEYVKKENVKEDITPIVDGVAKWMDNAAKGIGNYTERGYFGWFDFNKNSPKLSYYRKQHIKYRDMIEAYEKSEDIRIQNLVKLAKEIYLSHQYEFGCTGVSGTDEDWNYKRKYEAWENVKLVNVMIEVIKQIQDYQEGIFEQDINNDNIKEIIVVKNQDYYVFSKARGGRLLFWYDLERGIEIVGGGLGNNNNYPYYDGNILLKPFTFKNYVRFMAPGPELQKHIENTDYYVKYKALNDTLIKKNARDELVEENIYNYDMNYKLNEMGEIVFSSGDFVKTIKIEQDGLYLTYDYPTDVEYLKVESEFQPDYFQVVNNGREILEVNNLENQGEKEAKIISIYNKKSNIGIKVENINPVLENEEQLSFMGIILINYIGNGGSIKISKFDNN